MTPEKRRDAQRLDDMLKAVREIVEETNGLGREEYEQNRLVQKAVTYDIMILGDAASRISQRTKKANPQIPWAELAKYRSDEEEGPAHAYFNFDLPGTWQFIRDSVPELGRKLRRIRPPSDNR
jgi:uncharacterized protein with HEPN domain